MKIVINACFGGFGLSDLALRLYAEWYGWKLYDDGNKSEMFRHYYLVPIEKYEAQKKIDEDKGDYTESNSMYFSDHDIDRTDPALIDVVEKLGSKKASGRCASLKVVEIPDDVEWELDEYDGNETIREKHRSWS